MIYELSIEDFTRYTVRQVEELGNVTLSNPDTEEKFPVSVISNPMQSIKRTQKFLDCICAEGRQSP